MNGDTGRNDFVLIDGDDLPQSDVSLILMNSNKNYKLKAKTCTPIEIFDIENEKTSKLTKVQSATSISIYKRGLLYAHHTNEIVTTRKVQYFHIVSD
jgi:hypothetical protein